MAFPKVALMLPLLYVLNKKVDQTDPNVIMMVRTCFYTIQAVILAIVAYLYSQAQSMVGTALGKRVVFVPQASTSPFASFDDANGNKAKTKYQETLFSEHVVSTVRSLAGTVAFGVVLQTGLHFYRGMVAGMAMQCVMGPFNLVENPAARYFLFGDRVAFAEKTRDQLDSDKDEVIDVTTGEVVPFSSSATSTSSKAAAAGKTLTQKKKQPKQPSFEEVLLDAWDLGAEANVGPLLAILESDPSKVNFATAEHKWTPIMVLAGLGVPNTSAALAQLKTWGADPAKVDNEGWNALHWAAFHGCPDAAQFLLQEMNGLALNLHTRKDKEGKTALDHAIAESNTQVADIIQTFLTANNDNDKDDNNDNDNNNDNTCKEDQSNVTNDNDIKKCK